MADFQKLLSVVDDVKADAHWSQITALLVPLAALALQTADAIPGLPDVLRRHGWNGGSFSRAVELQKFKADLWALYGQHKEAQTLTSSGALTVAGPGQLQELQAVRGVTEVQTRLTGAQTLIQPATSLPAPSRWINLRPIESFIKMVEWHRDIQGHIAPGRLINELTHYAQVAIIDAGRMKLDCERFRDALKRSGWNRDAHAFTEMPDLDRLHANLLAM